MKTLENFDESIPIQECFSIFDSCKVLFIFDQLPDKTKFCLYWKEKH